MADNQQHNDDHRLAREIGEVLKNKKSLSDLSHPILPDLLTFKKETKEQLDRQIPPSGQTWERIQAEIESNTQKSSPANIFYLNKTVIAAAAAVLIVCFTGLFYYLTQPQLIGQSEDNIAVLTLEDGSQITLRPHSRLFKSGRWSTAGYEYSLTGEGYFEIKPREKEQFSVKAGNGIVRVLGTTFTLSNWSNKTEVFLEEGKVQIESDQNNSKAVLQPGESASVTARKITKTTPENPLEFTDWIRQELVFNNRRAGYVFTELEQHYQIEITAPDQILNNRLTGQMPLEDLEQTLQDLGIVLNGTFTKTDDQTYNFQTN